MKGCLDVSTAVAHVDGMQPCFTPPVTAPERVPKGVPKGAPFRACLGYPIWSAKSPKMAFWNAKMGPKSVKSRFRIFCKMRIRVQKAIPGLQKGSQMGSQMGSHLEYP